MKMHIVAALLLSAASMPALADTALVIGSGWQSDIVNTAGTPSKASNWTFTLSSGAHFSVSDAYVVGDVYTLTDTTHGGLGSTTFYAGTGIQSTGSFGSNWTDARWSKIDKYLGAGTYAINISGDGAGGLPAAFGVRLDSTVPEPAVWGLLIGGFVMTGAAMRRRTAATVAA